METRREARDQPNRPGCRIPITEDDDLVAALHGRGPFPPSHEWAHSVWVVEAAAQFGTPATRRFVANQICRRVLLGDVPWFVFAQQRQAGLEIRPDADIPLATLREWAATRDDAVFWAEVLALM